MRASKRERKQGLTSHQHIAGHFGDPTVTSHLLSSTAYRSVKLIYWTDGQRRPRHAVVTCEIKLFENYFSLRRRPSEIMLFQRVETCLKLFQNYFTGLLQLMNIFQHVHCC